MSDGGRARQGLLCPSARPDSPGVRIFGVVDRSGRAGAAAEVRYLSRLLPFGDRERERLGGVSPGRVYRLGAACAETGCRHFAGGACSLGERLVRIGPSPPPEHADEIQECALRSGCRWFHERGLEACRRCRWVVSEAEEIGGSAELRARVAMPAG